MGIVTAIWGFNAVDKKAPLDSMTIFSYMVGKGVPVHWGFIGAELVGIFIGSMIGPRTSKYIPDKWLKIIFIVLAFYVGIRYTTKGFLGYSILPPF